MNINLPKGFSFIVAALVAGLLATYGIHRYVTVRTSIPPVATGSVAVAAAEVSPGTAFSRSLVKVADWPQGLIPPQAASSLQQVDGRVAIMTIAQGEPILMGKLAPVGTAAGLSSLLEDSKRALTVRVDDVSGVAGFLHPGDRVDVLADLKMPDNKENFSKTILQNIMVMTTGQVWEQKGESKPTVVNTVTLEVTPKEAEMLNLASNEGKIRLALRSRRNQTIVATDGVATSELFEKKVKKADVSSETKKKEHTVEVIKGLERTAAIL